MNNFKRTLGIVLAFLMLYTILPLNTKINAVGGVDINETNFPNDNFRAYVKTLDADGDGKLSDTEIANVSLIDVSGRNIANLTGIEYFTALKELNCSFNKITSLDISQNTSLRALNCDHNQLTSLDLSNNTVLDELYCVDNQLTSLDLSKNSDQLSFRASSQKYNVKVKRSDMKINYSSFPGAFNITKAKITAGADSAFKVKDSKPSTVTYTYDTGLSGNNINVTLNITYIYTITFNKNGGTGNMDSFTVEGNSTYTLPACTFTAPAGQEFDCWSINGVEKNVGEAVTIRDDIDIKAIWKNKQCTITFDKNGGSGTMANVMAERTTNFTLPACTFTAPAGQEFDCWSINGAKKNVGDVITIYDDTTLKAIWKNKQCTITFDKNGGSGTMADVQTERTTNFTLPACTFTAPAGQEFKAWSINGDKKNVGDVITITGDTTLKAIWKNIAAPMPKPGNRFFDTGKGNTKYTTVTKPTTPKKHETKITLTIDSKKMYKETDGISEVTLMDTAPYIKNNRTLLSLRYVAEALGYDVQWVKETKTVIIQNMVNKIEIPVETNKIIVNGEKYESDVKPEITNNRTMLSIANIARALGLKDGENIFWDAAARKVTIIVK